jgi:hypothetical protein
MGVFKTDKELIIIIKNVTEILKYYTANSYSNKLNASFIRPIASMS